MGGRCRRRRRRSRRRQQPATAVPPARLLGIYVCVSAPICSVTCRGTGKEEEAAAAALAAAAAEAAVSAWVEQHREWWHECCCALPLHVIHCAAGGPSCLAQGAGCGPAHVGRAAHRPAVGTRLDSPAYLLALRTGMMPGTASLAFALRYTHIPYTPLHPPQPTPDPITNRPYHTASRRRATARRRGPTAQPLQRRLRETAMTRSWLRTTRSCTR